jgi:type I restriction enzyme S subunit
MELIDTNIQRTQFGLIPIDWDIVQLKEIIKEFIVPMRDKPKNLSGDIPWCRIEDFDGKYLYASKSHQAVDLATIQAMNLKVNPENTLLVSCSADLGRCAIVKNPLITNQTFIGLVTNNKVNEEFLFYIMTKSAPRLNMLSSGTTISYLSREQFEEFKIPLPPTLTEQKAIATALSDVDSLISSLDKLITKKKDIKQGAMQELLTPPHQGGRRLPGFSEDWEEITLGEIGQCIIGLTYSPTNVKDSGTLVLRSSNIQNGRFSSHDNVYVDCEIPEKLKVQENDILVCVRNGSRNLIGKSLMLSGELVGQTWGAFMSVYRSPINDYIAHLFNSNEIQRQIEENLGATINQITNRTLNSFKVIIPKELQEQKAITQILSDMDLEIESLENKKCKYQEIKQGMMQELLTGKTRLFWN